MPQERNSRTLAQRVDITFHRQPDRLRQARWRAGLVAISLVALAICLVELQGNKRVYQAGELSQAHRLLANDCQSCHSENWRPLVRLMPWHWDHPPVSTPDETCGKCHSGPPHHENQVGPVYHCATCHREHRGRATLSRVADGYCTDCHSDLKVIDQAAEALRGETTGSKPSEIFKTNINRFADHPEFAVLRKGVTDPSPGHGVHRVARLVKGTWQDRGAIRFNHRAHTTGSSRIECDACHRVDEASGYMEPIRYESHCAKCHQNELNVDSLVFGDRTVPHGNAKAARSAINEWFADFARRFPKRARFNVPATDATESLRQQFKPSNAPPTDQVKRAWIQERSGKARRGLFGLPQGGCRYCHADLENRGGKTPQTALWEVRAPGIPERWLAHGGFRHDRHRMLDCTACHGQAKTSHQTSDIMLPGVAKCRNCHTISSATAGSGSARSDCVECHIYHSRTGAPFRGVLHFESGALRARPLKEGN